jgi:hypothetical protein
MSVVKSAQANDKATQQIAVQQAAKAFEATVQSSNAASNAAVSMNQDMSANSATAAAQFSSQSTQSSQQTSVQASQGPQQQQQTSTQQQQVNKSVQANQQTQNVSQQQTFDLSTTSSVALKAPTSATIDIPVQSSTGTGLTVSRNPFAYNPLSSFNMSSMMPTPAQTAPVYQPKLQERIMELDTPQVQVSSFGGLGKAGNPLSEMMMQQRFEMMQENIQQQTSTVNRNVQPNDLAAGVDLASMAMQPKGFEAYSFALRDAAFYEPKEVYKNQKVIDNVQVLRQMSSDSLHKKMVDMQYKQGE